MLIRSRCSAIDLTSAERASPANVKGILCSPALKDLLACYTAIAAMKDFAKSIAVAKAVC